MGPRTGSLIHVSDGLGLCVVRKGAILILRLASDLVQAYAPLASLVSLGGVGGFPVVAYHAGEWESPPPSRGGGVLLRCVFQLHTCIR